MANGFLAQPHAVRRYAITHKFASLCSGDNLALGAKIKVQLVPEKDINLRHDPLCFFSSFDQDAEIIHVPNVVMQAENVLAILVKPVQVDVCCFLAGQVANRHTHIIQPLLFWAVVRAGSRRQSEWYIRVVEDHRHQPQKPLVVRVVPVDIKGDFVIHAVEIL